MAYSGSVRLQLQARQASSCATTRRVTMSYCTTDLLANWFSIQIELFSRGHSMQTALHILRQNSRMKVIMALVTSTKSHYVRPC